MTGPESFYAHLNKQFYFGHPLVYTVFDVLQDQENELTCFDFKIRDIDLGQHASSEH